MALVPPPPAASAEKLVRYLPRRYGRRLFHRPRCTANETRTTAISLQLWRTIKSISTPSRVARHAGWHRLVALCRGPIGKPWGTADRRSRARRSFGPVRRHVPSGSALSHTHSSMAPPARGRRLRAWRLHGLRRGEHNYASLCCTRWARVRRRTGPIRRVTRQSGAPGRMAPSTSRERGRCARRPVRVRRLGGRSGDVAWFVSIARPLSIRQPPACTAGSPCLPGALAPRGGKMRCASRRPGGLGSVGLVGARRHHIRARSGLGPGASAGADAHGRVRALR